mgnify:CR=1 FL=1
MTAMARKTRQPGWWYPYIFVGAFGVVLAVNGVLAYFATSSFTGLSTENAYEKGRLYNRNLALAKAQEALGWQVDTKVSPASTTTTPRADIAISYHDKVGQPVEGLNVVAALIRPTAAGHDHKVRLAPLGNGVYGGVFDLPLAGVWDMDVTALGEGDVSYQNAQRFVIP